MNDVIQGIARRCAYKFKSKSADDLAQDLWVTVLTKERNLGADLDLDLIARICYDAVTDMVRYELRGKRSCGIDASFERLEEQDTEMEYLQSRMYPDPADCTGMILRDLINSLPKDSKERKFIEYFGNGAGFLDTGIVGDGVQKGGYTEKDLALKLGYASSCSSGFTKLRYKVRKLIKEYIDEE